MLDPETMPGDTTLLCIAAASPDTALSDWQRTTLLMANIQSGDRTILAKDGIIRHPRLSHDGQRIVYEVTTDASRKEGIYSYPDNTGRTALSIYNVRTKATRALTKQQLFWGACWSANDRFIVAMFGLGTDQYSRLSEKHGEAIAGAPLAVVLPSNGVDITIKEVKRKRHYFTIGLRDEKRVVNGKTINRYNDLDYPSGKVFDSY